MSAKKKEEEKLQVQMNNLINMTVRNDRRHVQVVNKSIARSRKSGGTVTGKWVTSHPRQKGDDRGQSARIGVGVRLVP